MVLSALTLEPIITIDQKIAELFNNNFGIGGEWGWGNLLLSLLEIILSVVLCSTIGLEREKRGRSAGLRTHLLVGLGSCLLMIISVYGFPAGVTFDRARIAAGVVAGVGFLGAGAVIHNHGGIKGLTTASTIWIVMAIGLACGSGNFIIAIFATAIAMVVLVSFRAVERSVSRNCPMLIVLSDESAPVMSVLLNLAKELNCSIYDMNSSIFQNGNENIVETVLKLSDKSGNAVDANEFVSKLQNVEGIKSVEILNHH